MVDLERRFHSRLELQVPIKFRPSEFQQKNEVSGISIDISRGGLFLKSPCPIKVGSKLSLTVRVPTEISGSAFSSLERMGRVVYERAFSDGKLGYGIQFETPVGAR